MMPFCIIGTPRSRTAWLAEFLSFGGIKCHHEPSKRFRSDADIAGFFQPNVGASDSMLTLKWRELLAHGVKLIAVGRPRAEVLASAQEAGLPDGSAVLDLIEMELFHLRDTDVPMISFDQLDDAALSIFQDCHGHPPPAHWVNYWRDQIVEANFHDVLAATDIAGMMQFYNLRIS